MGAEDADAPTQTTFARAGDFIRDAAKLTSIDFGTEPTAVEDHAEQRILTALCSMLDEYQEQSYLLDPSLEALVSPLLTTLREHVRRPDCDLAGKRFGRLARLVYFITKVRGAKVIVRFFPHEVSDLSLLVSLLSPTSAASTSTSTATDLSAAPWELRYALLLWLSVCIRLPFSLALLAPGTSDAIEALGLQWLERSGREGEGAHEVLGRYFARNDADVGRLIKWCEDALQDASKPLLSLSLVSSLLLVLASASPSHIAPHFPRLYALLALLPPPADGRAGAGTAKSRAKLAGRFALLRLQVARDGGEEDVPEEVEVIVGELIEGLAHPDSIPRYSSAKYLARLALVLPASFAAQVIDAVLSTFEEALSPAERESGTGEGRAQGACLAVGEMARRGVLNRLEEKGEVVERVVECTMQALAYDHLTALHPIGSSVRDSASYVLWSLSRTLPASSLSPAQAQRLAECLLFTACLDREVSVRRAASAAWQEAVGRWGIFAHGIAILRHVDFFTVSIRHRAFLHAAVSVASYDPYRSAIVAHLLGGEGGTGIAHYDAEIRALAAQALGKIVAAAREELAAELVSEQIGKLARTKDIANLQGLLLSLAALAEAVDGLPDQQREELRREVFAAVCALHPTTRSLARNHLVLSSALAALARSAPCPSSTPHAALPHNWFDVVHFACDRSEESVHAAAGEALRAVSLAADCPAEVDHLLADLDSRSGTRQQAAALLLGQASYPPWRAHSVHLPTVVGRLSRLVQRDPAVEGRAGSIEARRNAVEALAEVLVAHGATLAEAHADLLSAALDAVLAGFSDYTTDQRGDVGSWVRTATITAFPTLVRAGLVREQPVLDAAVGGMAKQAVERLDGVREAAGRALMDLWESLKVGEAEGGVMRGQKVWEGIASEERWDWRDLNWASERILLLLSVPEYRDAILEGAVLANTAYSASTPFLDYALLLPPSASEAGDHAFTLLALLRSLHTLGKTHFPSNRLSIPLLSLIAALAEIGALDPFARAESDDEGAKMLRQMLALACTGVGRIKNPARLGAATKVVTTFLALPLVARTAAVRLPLFLAHPQQPWLRQQTADELFGALAALGFVEAGGDEGAGEGEGGELERLLLETSWTTDGTQQQADRVAELVGALVGSDEGGYV